MRVEEGSYGEAANHGWKHFIPGGSGDFSSVIEVARERAPVARINAVYKEYLDMLSLNAEHTKLNVDRGFTLEQIDALQYKTVEDKTNELIDLGLDLSFVPGFYKDEFGAWASSASKLVGYFVPVRDLRQRVVAMQIRLDTGKPKYLWFSTNGLTMGATSGSPIHRSIIGFKGSGPTWITESPIKADFISAKFGVQAIGIAGVNAGHNDVVNALLEPNHKDVIIAFDGNWKSNQFVFKALVSLIKKLRKDVPCRPKIAVWDDDCGIDDAYQNNIDIDILTDDEWVIKNRKTYLKCLPTST